MPNSGYNEGEMTDQRQRRQAKPQREASENRPAAAGTEDEVDAYLVGWAVNAPGAHDRALEPDQSRDFLGTALGIPADKLNGLDDVEVEGAVVRLRGLVDRFRDVAAEAAVDDLTGALRRGAGLAALQREIDRARRTPGHGAVVVFIDADGLKQVNDTRGHAAGDEFLRTVVAALRDRLRSYDVVVRYGGDEFFCVLTNVTVEFTEHLIDDIKTVIRTRTNGLTVSTGVTAVLPDDDAATVVARADGELYSSRRGAVRR